MAIRIPINARLQAQGIDLSKAGIYRIAVSRGNKLDLFYIGQTRNLKNRKAAHLSYLRGGYHGNSRLQRAFDKYGENAFTFEVLLICEPTASIMCLYEQAIVDSYDRALLYNINLECVNSTLGMTLSKDARKKIGDYWRGRKRSPEHGERTAAAKRGIPRPEWVNEKVRQAHLGKKLSDEHKKKLSAAGKGKKRSAETRAKISAGKIGNKNSLGHRHSSESKAKMSASVRAGYSKRRARLLEESGQKSLF